MAVSVIENRYQLQMLMWYGVMAFGLLMAAVLLASDFYLVALGIVGLGWLATLPYHAKLSAVLAMATYSSAFILPFVPGRPYAWEAAAMLAWSGVLVLVLFRRFPQDFRETIYRNRWIYIGTLVYCVTLIFIMQMRGFGLRILGSGQAGGRFYLQQLICAILPVLFAMVRMEERQFVRLMLFQWLLAITYFVSDFAFAFGGAGNPLLRFFEVPSDAYNFENQSTQFGIRRFQSFQNAGLGLTYLLLGSFSLREFFGRRMWWLLPAFLAVFGVSLLSGHRSFVVVVSGILLVLGYAQRFFTMRTLILSPLIATLVLLVVYERAGFTPLAVQRAISFLPGIDVSPQAAADAKATLDLRRALRKIGMEMIPDHLWVGRGFTAYLDAAPAPSPFASLEHHVLQGSFYNGFIGLLVNTGITGTLGMLVVIGGGTALALRVLRLVRRFGVNDNLTRIASVLVGLWLTSVMYFLFLHGDSHAAMKNFAMQLGALILVERLLLRRESATATEAIPLETGT